MTASMEDELRTLVLQDGTVLRLVDIKRARVDSHTFRPSQYYVDLDMRDGSTREDIQYVSKETADKRRNKIVALMQQAWEEVDPFECGYAEGAAESRSQAHSAGLEEGRSQGYQRGWDNGFRDGKQSIILALLQRREDLMREQSYWEGLPPSRRRFVRNAIDVLTEIIQSFPPDGSET